MIPGYIPGYISEKKNFVDHLVEFNETWKQSSWMAAGWDEGLDLLKVLIWGQCNIPKNLGKKVLVFFSSLKVKMLIYCWKGAFVLRAYADVISYNLFERFRFAYTWDSVFFYFWVIFQKFLWNCYFLGTRQPPQKQLHIWHLHLTQVGGK